MATVRICLRLPVDQARALDDWIALQPRPRPSRPMALRLLAAESLARRLPGRERRTA